MSAAFARNRLMPALAINTSLRELDSDSAEADTFVAARLSALEAVFKAPARSLEDKFRSPGEWRSSPAISAWVRMRLGLRSSVY